MYPLCTMYARCGFTRLVVKQSVSGLYYYVKCGHDAHWKRIEPCELLDYIPSVDDLETSTWVHCQDTDEWVLVEGLAVELERRKTTV